jgi:hypothetical protein
MTNAQITTDDAIAIAEIAAHPTDRASVISSIKQALRQRSGRSWSVTGGKGTAYNWLTIDVLPSECRDFAKAEETRKQLATLLGLARIHSQGHDVPGGNDYYREIIARARYGTDLGFVGKPYWD